MKNLVLLFALFVTTLTFSQDHQVKIRGLVNGGQFTNLNMEEVHFDLEMNNSGRGGSNTVMYYTVTKRHDNNSERLENALRNGRVFNEVQVWVKQAGGKVVKHKLTNAVLSDYSASFKRGKPATESFVIKFQNRTILR